MGDYEKAVAELKNVGVNTETKTGADVAVPEQRAKNKAGLGTAIIEALDLIEPIAIPRLGLHWHFTDDQRDLLYIKGNDAYPDIELINPIYTFWIVVLAIVGGKVITTLELWNALKEMKQAPVRVADTEKAAENVAKTDVL